MRLHPGVMIEAQKNYTERDVQIHALGCGIGMHPDDLSDLAWLAEPDPDVLPVFALVLGAGAGLFTSHGIPWNKLVVLSHNVETLRPLPAVATVSSRDEVVHVEPKPKINATIMTVRTSIREADAETISCRFHTKWLVRELVAEEAAGIVTNAEQRTADGSPFLTTDIRTSPQAALIFRLLGGRSPIHFDPSAARAAGFDGPILHGPAILGHVLGAMLKEASDLDPGQVEYFGCEYRGVLYPGETLRLECNRFENEIKFQATCVERGTQVLERGVLSGRS
ncbi:MaoC/PaaZ C-terminal domain-containing protein [Roseovarius sp. C7]|uniref:MaoC/PaaZ C-terminal domain-containing protein n=1 Tax=Roseovarius sp. C7 TaxID=3398643 RepID=UPI0039F6C3C5